LNHLVLFGYLSATVRKGNHYYPRAQESGAVHLVELLAKTLFFSQRSSYLDTSYLKELNRVLPDKLVGPFINLAFGIYDLERMFLIIELSS